MTRTWIALQAIRGATASMLMLLLLHHWFARADRHQVFLYGHVDRPGDLAARPFDPITSSRYWMAPLVAAGTILILLLVLEFIRLHTGRHRSGSRAHIHCPAAWLGGAPLLGLGIPAITTRLNQPTLPPEMALQVTLSGLVGLGLAFIAAGSISRHPRRAAWMAVESLGLLAPLLCIRTVELPSRGIMTPDAAWFFAASSIIAGWIWLRSIRALARRMGIGRHPPVALIAAAYIWAALGFPLLHHLVATPPGFKYISSAGNVFGFGLDVALSSLVVVALLALAHGALDAHLHPKPGYHLEHERSV